MKYVYITAQVIMLCMGQFFVTPLANASDAITKAINKYYPDYQIVESTLFNIEIINDSKIINPALVIGRFNGDDIDDFAAILRSRELRVEKIEQLSREYYLGKVVACQGGKSGAYDCQVLITDFQLFKPHHFFITKRAPVGKIECWGNMEFWTVKSEHEYISYERWNSSIVDFIYQDNGKYIECTSAD